VRRRPGFEAAVAAPVPSKGNDIRVTASIGIAPCLTGADEPVSDRIHPADELRLAIEREEPEM
jgi:GGDEF domain-containing protein